MSREGWEKLGGRVGVGEKGSKEEEGRGKRIEGRERGRFSKRGSTFQGSRNGLSHKGLEGGGGGNGPGGGRVSRSQGEESGWRRKGWRRRNVGDSIWLHLLPPGQQFLIQRSVPKVCVGIPNPKMVVSIYKKKSEKKSDTPAQRI